MRGLGRISMGAAGLVLATAMVVFGATLADAVRVQEPRSPGEPKLAERSDGPGSSANNPLPDVSAEEGGPGGEEATVPGADAGRRQAGLYPRIDQAELLDAVNRDAFQPDRSPPLERYQLPGERIPTREVQPDTRRRRGPELRVVGAAVMGEMAIALVQVDDSIPLAVLLGESVGGYMLAAVDQESAVLMSLTETLTLPVVEPLTRGQSSEEPVQIRIDGRNVEQLRGQMQEVLRRQFMNERGQLIERGFPPTSTNPPGRGGRGGGGRP